MPTPFPTTTRPRRGVRSALDGAGTTLSGSSLGTRRRSVIRGRPVTWSRRLRGGSLAGGGPREKRSSTNAPEAHPKGSVQLWRKPPEADELGEGTNPENLYSRPKAQEPSSRAPS